MEINYLVAVVAALSSFLLGGLWYSPVLALKRWNKAMGRNENSSQGHTGQFVVYAVILGLRH